MNGNVTAVLLILIILSAIVVIVYINVRKKERIELIRKGIDVSIFENNDKKKGESFSLKFGLLLTGVGVGILLANILVRTNALEDEVAYSSMIFLFGGISLLIDYFIERKRIKNSK